MLPVKVDRPTQTRVSRPGMDLHLWIHRQAEDLSVLEKSDHLDHIPKAEMDQPVRGTRDAESEKSPTLATVRAIIGPTDKETMPHRGEGHRAITKDQSVNLQILDVLSQIETRNRMRKFGHGVIHPRISTDQHHFQNEIVVVAPAQLTDRRPKTDRLEKPLPATITAHGAEKLDRAVVLRQGVNVQRRRPEIRTMDRKLTPECGARIRKISRNQPPFQA